MTREKPLILLVDDDRDFRDSTAEVLMASGFDVAPATNGEEGINKAETLLPDLILMDIKMPVMNGVDAALKIKQNPKTSDIKIAFLTGWDNPWPAIVGEKSDVAKELGMEDYIKKTEDPKKLVEKVKGFLGIV
ncbi:MAG: response regulator [Patescibacteria group bacterium]|nr:response regulator [Patescibacteria group bacterium]MDE2015795.1 response regulator [Patescibacteria group bacterium]MDE2227170.1 response regulator [Patescibacteria group bacterium]